jgi:hypothetical protein
MATYVDDNDESNCAWESQPEVVQSIDGSHKSVEPILLPAITSRVNDMAGSWLQMKE